MENFEITFLYPTDGGSTRSQSLPNKFQAESVDHAKRHADAMIERESLTHRTVSTAVLTTTDDHLTEITRWSKDRGWMDA